jgi:hypothetical protein
MGGQIVTDMQIKEGDAADGVMGMGVSLHSLPIGSPEQRSLTAVGAPCAIVLSLDDARLVLKAWGIPTRDSARQNGTAQ